MTTENNSNDSTEIVSNIIPVPTLSTNGWVRDTAGKIDFLLAHFVSSDPLQSNIYRDHVSNLQKLIQNHGGDPAATAGAISRSLQVYLSRYYQNVIAEASFSLINEKESETTVKITLALNFTEEGVQLSANRLLTYFNGKFKSISEVNNGTTV